MRQILYISLNHYRHLTAADWPPHLRANMNSTLAPDWAFHAEARALWAAQVRTYGEQRLGEDAAAHARRVAAVGAAGSVLEYWLTDTPLVWGTEEPARVPDW